MMSYCIYYAVSAENDLFCCHILSACMYTMCVGVGGVGEVLSPFKSFFYLSGLLLCLGVVRELKLMMGPVVQI